MNVTIELSPEVETGLAALASRRQIPLARLVQELLEEAVAGQPSGRLLPKERAAAWRASSGGVEGLPLLTEAGMSRETIYGERG